MEHLPLSIRPMAEDSPPSWKGLSDVFIIKIL